MEKEGKMYRHAKLVKERVEWFRCSKWAQACISKFRKIVISAMGRDKLLEKEANVKHAKERKF
jgi:hypothetical protein